MIRSWHVLFLLGMIGLLGGCGGGYSEAPGMTSTQPHEHETASPEQPAPSRPRPSVIPRAMPGPVPPDERGPTATIRLPTPSHTPLAEVDEWVRHMQTAQVVFNVPQRINVADTAVVRLLLSVSQDMKTLRRQLREQGRVVEAEVKVTERMEARLTGPKFRILAITPEVQAISTVEPTRWAWEVVPTEPGRHRLHLTLTALLKVDGQQVARAVRTFDREVEVEVTPAQRVTQFVQQNWKWLWATLLVPGIGWLWRRRRKRKAVA